MSIPNDPENRWWIDASDTNPDLVSRLRSGLLAFLAFGPDKKAKIAGSGFIIAGNSDIAFVITANHVIPNGIQTIQKPVPAYALSAIFVPKSATTPSIDPAKLKAIWMGQDQADLLDIVHVGSCDTLDATILICTPTKLKGTPFLPTSIPIDTSVPKVGDVVHMYSLDKLEVSTAISTEDHSSEGKYMSLTRRVCIRVGVVTGVYMNGRRQHQWPCFTTSIPAEPGMSGGIVTLPSEGKTIAACGIVSSDFSVKEAQTDCHQCGESLIASTWPTLALPVPELDSSKSTKSTLYHLMRSGKIPVAIGGIDHIQLEELGDGNYTVKYKK